MVNLDRILNSLTHGPDLKVVALIFVSGQRLDAKSLQPNATYVGVFDPVQYRRAGRPQDLYSDLTAQGFRLYTTGSKGRLECLTYPRMKKIEAQIDLIISREVLR